MSWDRLEQRRNTGDAVPGWTPEVGTRFAKVVRQLGGGEAAGKIAGVTSEMISRYINGRAKPNLYAIAVLAAAAGVTVDWILTDSEPAPAGPRPEAQPVGLDGLPERLGQIVKILGSAAELSRKSGVPASSIRDYVAGKSVPSAAALVAMALGSGASLDWLATKRGTMLPEQQAEAQPVALDGKLLGRLSEEVDRIYREENQRLGRGQAVEVAAGIYGELVGIADEAERRGAMTYALGQLRRTLRDAASAPASVKRSD